MWQRGELDVVERLLRTADAEARSLEPKLPRELTGFGVPRQSPTPRADDADPAQAAPRDFVHCLHQPSGLIGPRTVLQVAQVVSTGAGTKFKQLMQN